jgi:hypothetical protein
MNPSWIAAIAVILINILGWSYTKIYGFGKLNGRVEKLEETTNRHEKILNDGVVQKIADLQSQVSNLEGTVQTYIDLAKRG